jgi:uncharacterized membrane protein
MGRSPLIFFPFLIIAAAVLLLLLLFLFALIKVGLITVAFSKLDLSPGAVLLLLLGTLVGSAVNLPLYSRNVRLTRIVPAQSFLWRHYRQPMGNLVEGQGRQTICVNVGGCVIPVLLSAYFLHQIGPTAGLLMCLTIVSLATFKLAKPIPGLGIGIPFLVPPLITVLAVWLFARPEHAAHVAYIAGSVGTLIGADVMHLIDPRKTSDLNATLLSIGGAGTFDGIFLTGIIAVLLA